MDEQQKPVADTARCETTDESCCATLAASLNDSCFCVSVDHDGLRRAIEKEAGGRELFALLEQRCPYVFAANPVFVSRDHVQKMRELVQAVESVVALPAYREQVLGYAPAIARHDPGQASGVFFGYDFHLQGQEIALIEINTNAGGAMLNAVLARAQHACCDAVDALLPSLDVDRFEREIIDMFRTEWRSRTGAKDLQTIAIVDAQPRDQYLYPEFLLFQRLFARRGIHAVIADPSELSFADGRLHHRGTPIDLVYNRLTDFMLEEAGNAALRDAYLTDAVVLTPHPQAHALYANKRNLALLSDPALLSAFGVPAAVQQILLAGIPRTEIVSSDNAERLWSQRRQLFFKPAAGYGSRAAYRGDKLTKRVWEEIVAGDYVAQLAVAPLERATTAAGDGSRLKFDLRAYAYDGGLQWLAARLYQGQTTNFRTPGGGFAPVYQY